MCIPVFQQKSHLMSMLILFSCYICPIFVIYISCQLDFRHIAIETHSVNYLFEILCKYLKIVNSGIKQNSDKAKTKSADWVSV